MVGREFGVAPLRPMIMVGAPPGSDCFERSKSDNMMCPDWCNKMSTRVSGSLTWRVGGTDSLVLGPGR